MTARMNTNEYEIVDDSFIPSGNERHDAIVIEIMLSNKGITREGTQKCFSVHRDSKEKSHVATVIDVIFKGDTMPNMTKSPNNQMRALRVDEAGMQHRAKQLKKEHRAGNLRILSVDRVQEGSEDGKMHYLIIIFHQDRMQEQRRLDPVMFYIFGIITDPDEPIIFTQKANRDAIYNYITAPKK